MPPQTRYKGESKQGLIITLVFFILTTIGLGVAVYFGFAEQEKKDQEVKTAKKDGEVFKKERDQYKFQYAMLRSFIGQGKTVPGVENLGTQKTQFDQGTLKLSEDDTKVLKALLNDKRSGIGEAFGWNGNQPKKTFEDEIEKWKKDYAALEKGNEGLTAEKKALADKLAKAEGDLNAAQDDYKKQLADLNKKSEKDQESIKGQLDKLRETVTQSGETLGKVRGAAEQDKNALKKQIDSKGKEMAQLKEKLAKLEGEVADRQAKNPVSPPSMRTDWKIVAMDRRGQNPYINLGSADRVKPQLTFSIHGVTLDGRPIPQPKGTLEVVNVIEPHLSQTRITSVKDANRDPILKGDVLYNPSWDPTLKKHVALAGIMDITGDGRDSLSEFMRNLARQNIIVDAYLNPKDGSVKGQITLNTDYLILGESQEFSPTGKDKPVGEAQKNVDAGRKLMEDEAAKKGVKVVALHKYLEMIGYRLPRGAGAERPSLYNPNLRPDQAPRMGGEKPPAMKPDK